MIRQDERTAPHRILVMGVNWLGDTVMSLPALAALRELSPGEEIHVGAPSPLAKLIRLAAPVDEVREWPSWGATIRRIRQARSGGYGRAVLFPNSFRSAWIAWWAGIPERWGYSEQLRGWLLNRPVPSQLRPRGVHHSQVYLEIVRAMGWRGSGVPEVRFRIPNSARQWADEVLGPGGRTEKIVGLCPGAAYGPAKRWPSDRFVAVARGLRDRHGVRVVLLGGPAERVAIGEIASAIGETALNLSGATDMEGLVAILDRCRIVISNDSGPMHLAAALGTPVVALFGSTDPIVTAPLGPHRIVRAAVPCSPCLKRTCPDGTYQCLTAISPEQVLHAAEELLMGAAPSRETVL